MVKMDLMVNLAAKVIKVLPVFQVPTVPMVKLVLEVPSVLPVDLVRSSELTKKL